MGKNIQVDEKNHVVELETAQSFGLKKSPGPVNWLSDKVEKKQLPFTSEVACHHSEIHYWAD